MSSYRDLLTRADAPRASSWRLFGDDDELGTVNHLTRECVLEAVKCVRSGDTVGLDYPINAFDPPIARTRRTALHHIFQRHPNHRDDYVDRLYPQSSSHIDGLRHRRHEQFGFYNGFADDSIREDSPTLGVNRWADCGIVGRGVLADVAGYLDRQGRPLDYGAGEAFDVGVVEAALAASGTESRPGDLLIIRTGFSRFYLEELSGEERARFVLAPRAPGLVQSEETLEWIWDRRLALLAADNIAVEVSPPVADSPFHSMDDGGKMHPHLIALFGLVIGELWAVEALVEACRKRNSSEFMLVVKPLNLIGGVGSPANAVAIL